MRLAFFIASYCKGYLNQRFEQSGVICAWVLSIKAFILNIGCFMLPVSLEQILAIVADAYNPLLLLSSLFICVQMWRQGYPFYFTRLVGAAFAVYFIMFMDIWLGIWLCVGLDYSTHTATSLAMIIFISKNKSVRIKVALGVSLLIYGEIMKFLNYHSWGDVVSTAVVIGLTVILIGKLIVKVLPSRYRNEPSHIS